MSDQDYTSPNFSDFSLDPSLTLKPSAAPSISAPAAAGPSAPSSTLSLTSAPRIDFNTPAAPSTSAPTLPVLPSDFDYSTPSRVYNTPISQSTTPGMVSVSTYGGVSMVDGLPKISVETIDVPFSDPILFWAGNDPVFKAGLETVTSKLRPTINVADVTKGLSNSVEDTNLKTALQQKINSLATISLTDAEGRASLEADLNTKLADIRARETAQAEFSQKVSQESRPMPEWAGAEQRLAAAESPAAKAYLESTFKPAQAQAKAMESQIADYVKAGDGEAAYRVQTDLQKLYGETMSDLHTREATRVDTGMFRTNNLLGTDPGWNTEGVMLGMTVFGSIYGIYASQKSAEDQMEFQKEMGDLTWERQKELLAIQQGYALDRIGAQGEAETTGRSAPTGYKSSGTQGKVKVK